MTGSEVYISSVTTWSLNLALSAHWWAWLDNATLVDISCTRKWNKQCCRLSGHKNSAYFTVSLCGGNMGKYWVWQNLSSSPDCSFSHEVLTLNALWASEADQKTWSSILTVKPQTMNVCILPYKDPTLEATSQQLVDRHHSPQDQTPESLLPVHLSLQLGCILLWDKCVNNCSQLSKAQNILTPSLDLILVMTVSSLNLSNFFFFFP